MILVTGGAGYVGSHTLREIRKTGEEVVVVDDLSEGHRTAVGDAQLVRVDLGDLRALRQVFSVYDVDGFNETAWIETALDLARLGYGRVRERDADSVALDAILSLGYDPVAVGRYLARVGERARAGAAEISEVAAAHPPAEDRARRIDRSSSSR